MLDGCRCEASWTSAPSDFAGEPNVAAIFLNDGQPYKAGERLKQPELAKTLETDREGRHRCLLQGRRSPGRSSPPARPERRALHDEGFRRLHRRNGRSPVTCDYRGYTVVSAPPPSSGGTTVCEILQIVRAYPFAKWGYGSVEVTHYLVEAERQRLCRPQHLSRRSGLREEPDRRAALAGACRRRSAPRSSLTGPRPLRR